MGIKNILIALSLPTLQLSTTSIIVNFNIINVFMLFVAYLKLKISIASICEIPLIPQNPGAMFKA
jgi:hypothetical protein